MRRGATPSSVTVAVRVRPLSEKEKQIADQSFALDIGDQYVALPNDSTYVFDAVFGPDQSNQDVYDAVAEPIVSSSLAGINGTIFAYGQTASGKTFSMQGSESEPGILRLAARQLFDVARSAQWTYTFVVSYIEIYNERVKDLMSNATGRSGPDASDLKIREDRQNGFYVDGVVERAVDDYEAMMELFQEGEKRRHVAGTDMNLKSSRSHTIFTINVTAKQKANETGDFAFGTLKSRLSLVDLAGSESARLTNAEGDRLKEGAQINKSLLALSLVISSLSKTTGKDAHVKFRDSKLTQILQPSLAGNCRTAVVCCVTPAATYLTETSSTLKFASSAKHVQTQYVVNQIADVSRSIKSYQDQLESLSVSLKKEQAARAIAEKAAQVHGAEQVIKLETRIRELEEMKQRFEIERDIAHESLSRKQEEVEALQTELSAKDLEAMGTIAKERDNMDEEKKALNAKSEEAEAKAKAMIEEAKSQIEKERQGWNEYVEQIKKELEGKASELQLSLDEAKRIREVEQRSHMEQVDTLNSTWQKRLDETTVATTLNADEAMLKAQDEWKSSMESSRKKWEEALQSELKRNEELLERLDEQKTITESTQKQLEVVLSEKAQMKSDHEAMLSQVRQSHQEELEVARQQSESALKKNEQEWMDRMEHAVNEEINRRVKVQAEMDRLSTSSQSSLVELNQQKSDVEVKLTQKEHELVQAQTRMDELQSLLDAESNDRQQLQFNSDELRKQCDKLEETLQVRNSSASKQEKELLELLKREQAKASKLEAEIDHLKTAEKEMIDNATSAQEELNQRIALETKRALDLDMMLKETKTRLAIAHEEVSKSKYEKEKLAGELRSEIESLKHESEASEDSLISKLRSENNEKAKLIRDLNDRLTTMKKLYEEDMNDRPWVAEKEEMTKENEELKQRIDHLEQKVTKLDAVKMTKDVYAKIADMQSENLTLQGTVRELQSYKAKYEGLKSRVQKSTREDRGLAYRDENATKTDPSAVVKKSTASGTMTITKQTVSTSTSMTNDENEF